MINLKTVILITLLLFVSQLLSAQLEQKNSSNDFLVKIQEKEEGKGEVLLYQDMRINNLIYNHVEQNKRKGGVPGYRIRIYSDLGNTARDDSQSVKAKFYELFPEIPVYREYDSPYFKVYVGDFRTKIDALKEFKRIKRHFPAAFIVPDKINYPNLEE